MAYSWSGIRRKPQLKLLGSLLAATLLVTQVHAGRPVGR
jgi:hypothetical protein